MNVTNLRPEVCMRLFFTIAFPVGHTYLITPWNNMQ